MAVGTYAAGSSIYHHDNRVSGATSMSLFADYTGNSEVSAPPLVDDAMRYLPVAQVQGYVLAHAGAWPSQRDSTEQRVINDVIYRVGQQKYSIAEAGGPAGFEEFARAPDVAVTILAHLRPHDESPSQLEPAAEFLEYLDRRVEVLKRSLFITPREVELATRGEGHTLPVRHVGPAGGFEGGFEALLGLVELTAGDEGLAAGGVHPHRLDGLVGTFEKFFHLAGEFEDDLVVALELGDACPGAAAIKLALLGLKLWRQRRHCRLQCNAINSGIL